MKKKFINTETIEGYLYQHKLALKTVQDPQSKNFGKEFINGSVFVATDEAGLNVIEVHYTYVPVVTNAGSANKTFTALKQIMEAATWIENGKDAAIKVKLSPSLALNDFYDKTNTLVSAKRNEGGFAEIVASINADETKRATFKTDIVMTSIKRCENDEEKGITEDFDEIRGAIFDFKGSVLPFDFRVRNEAGMDYFEGLDISSSNPVFTTIWGTALQVQILILLLSAMTQLLLLMNSRLLCRTEKFILQRLRRDRMNTLQVSLLLQNLRQHPLLPLSYRLAALRFNFKGDK